MVQYIDLGGKKRPILYGTAAFRMLKQRTGMSLAKFIEDVSSGEPGAICDITFCALRVGERADRIPPSDDFETEEDVAIWIDLYPGGIEQFYKLVLDALPKSEAVEGELEPGEAKPIGTGTS